MKQINNVDHTNTYGHRSSLLDPLDIRMAMNDTLDFRDISGGERSSRRSFCAADKNTIAKNQTDTFRRKELVLEQYLRKNTKFSFKKLYRRSTLMDAFNCGRKIALHNRMEFWTYTDFSSQKVDFTQGVLENDSMRNIFYQFLKSEHSEENLEYYIAVNEFKKLDPNCDDFKQMAKKIYYDFLQNGSSKMVNVDHNCVRIVVNQLENPKPEMFDRSLKQIVRLIQSDSLTRFLTSNIYQEITQQPYLHFDTVINMPINHSLEKEKVSILQRFVNKYKPKINNGNLLKKNKKSDGNILLIIPECDSMEKWDPTKTNGEITIYSQNNAYNFIPRQKKTLKQALQTILPKDIITGRLCYFKLPSLSIIDPDAECITLRNQTLVTKLYASFKLIIGEEQDDPETYTICAPSDDIIGEILTTLEDKIGFSAKENIFYQVPNITICLTDTVMMYSGWEIKLEKIPPDMLYAKRW